MWFAAVALGVALGVADAVVVASYFAAENTEADSVGGIAVVAGNCSETQSYLAYGS